MAPRRYKRYPEQDKKFRQPIPVLQRKLPLVLVDEIMRKALETRKVDDDLELCSNFIPNPLKPTTNLNPASETNTNPKSDINYGAVYSHLNSILAGNKADVAGLGAKEALVVASLLEHTLKLVEVNNFEAEQRFLDIKFARWELLQRKNKQKKRELAANPYVKEGDGKKIEKICGCLKPLSIPVDLLAKQNKKIHAAMNSGVLDQTLPQDFQVTAFNAVLALVRNGVTVLD